MWSCLRSDNIGISFFHGNRSGDPLDLPDHALIHAEYKLHLISVVLSPPVYMDIPLVIHAPVQKVDSLSRIFLANGKPSDFLRRISQNLVDLLRWHLFKKIVEISACILHLVFLLLAGLPLPAFLLSYASAFPSSSQALSASASGASLQITQSQASTAPSSRQVSSQFLIHSPSPHP